MPLVQYGIEDKYGPPGHDNGPASPSNHTSSHTNNVSSSYNNNNPNPNYYVCTNCNIAQGVVQYIQLLRTLYLGEAHEQSILRQCYQAAVQAIHSHEQQQATKSAVDDLLQSVSHTNGESTANESDAVVGVDGPNETETTTTTTGTTTSNDESPMDSPHTNEETANHATTEVLFQWIQSSKSTIDEWTRQCGALNNLIHDMFLPGYIDGTELIDILEEMIGPDHMDTTTGPPNQIKTTGSSSSSSKVSASQLKQQAFRNCAGDMGTAMKLLLEQAIPTHYSSSSSSSSGTTSKGMDVSSRNDTFANTQNDNIDLFRCVLEFLLDLCDDSRGSNNHVTTPPEDVTTLSSTTTTTSTVTSNLSSISFFWPQLCHIHLRMLPATDATSLARIDLMEDFLLTVATKYSIHLALELVWSHTADLEESLQLSSSAPLLEQSTKESSVPHNNEPHNNAVSSACRRRRFAIIRFLCELESLLFDFDGGWGGGSVTLGKMFIPTPHQVHIMKVAMTYIQQYRMGIVNENDTNKAPNRPKGRCLSRSARWDRLFREYDTSRTNDKSPTEQAQEKLRIAKHADYFSSHLIFSKRLADIAEKLRFLDVSERAGVLEHELNQLNASGVMGGDPLNRLRDHLIRVVRVPSTESHVFRSKERTPILLLMEIVDERNDALDAAASNHLEAGTSISNPSLLGEQKTIDDEESHTVPTSETPESEHLTTEQTTCEPTTERGNDNADDNDVPKPPPYTPSMLEGASEGNIRLSPGRTLNSYCCRYVIRTNLTHIFFFL